MFKWGAGLESRKEEPTQRMPDKKPWKPTIFKFQKYKKV